MSIVKRLTPYSGLKVLISGGAAGIGEVIAAAYLETGAKVHVCDVSEQAVLAFRERYPQALATQADVSSAAEVKRVFELQREWVNGLDVLINNAGIAGPTTGIEKITEDEWEQSININLNAQYRFAHHAVPLLAESAHAHIIHISSVAGRLGYAWRTPYAATKWAIIGLMKSLAAELGDRDIRVNALLLRNPSVIHMLDGCAISIPCHAPGELPVGLQLIGGYRQDSALLEAAQQVDMVISGL